MGNSGLFDAEDFGNRFLIDSIRHHFAYLSDLIHIESCPAIARTNRGPSLSHLVSMIVDMGAHKEMVWTNAWRVVTFMANLLSMRDISAADLPRNSMRFLRFSRIGHVKNTVTVSIFSRSPCPAPLSCFNFGFKPMEVFI
jgi:hypothetical protein